MEPGSWGKGYLGWGVPIKLSRKEGEKKQAQREKVRTLSSRRSAEVRGKKKCNRDKRFCKHRGGNSF